MLRSLAVLLLFCIPASAADVAVPGTDTAFAEVVQQYAHGKLVNLKITGTALRTKFTVKIYGMASYVLDSENVKTGEDLAKLEKPKLLHLVMERKATGKDFVDAFTTAVGSERAGKEFADEFKKLKDALGNATADKGDQVTLLYVPDAGTRIRMGKDIDVTIPGSAFGRAIWECYLGQDPLDADMKKGLMSQAK